MATYYVHGDTGSDANPGTAASPFKTLNALSVMADGDTAYLAGRILSHDNASARITFTSKSNLTIGAWAGQTAPTVRGYKLVTGDWTDNEDGTWDSEPIATGLTLSGLVYEWEDSVNADGQHYGHCRLYGSKAAVQAAASGDKGKFFYDSGTGVITGYFGGADPNGNEVGFVASQAVEAAFRFVSCTNCIVQDIDIGCYPVHSGQFGWAVRWEQSTLCQAVNCQMHDTGAHAVGTVGAGTPTGNRVINCTIIGGAPASTLVIFHSSSNAITSQTESCTIKTGRWLGIDDAVLDGRGDTVAAVDSNTQIGWYAHANGGGLIFEPGAFQINNCSISNIEAGVSTRPWAADNCVPVAAADRTNPAKFPVIASGGSVTNFEPWNPTVQSASWYARRVAFSTNITVATGFGAAGAFLHMVAVNSSDYFYTFDSCTFVASLDGSGAGVQTRMFSAQASTGGTKRITFVNCSFYNNNTHADGVRGFFDQVDENILYFESYGSIFAHKTTGAGTCLLSREGAAAVTGNPFRDNLYFNIDDTFERYAQIQSYNATEWVTLVDTAATVLNNVLGANPYDDETTLEPTATVIAKSRALTTNLPSGTGINGLPYSGDFGAFQYGAVGGGGGGGGGGAIHSFHRRHQLTRHSRR